MLRGEGWYYTPISADGQVVRKHVDSIVVRRENARPRIVVSYTLTNPYDHPVTVPIQSGLTLLYQFAQSDDEQKDPQLHVVPATVTRHANGELLYVAEGSGSVLGTTAIQRQHLGTGVPNYRHPVAVNVTLVPGDSVEIEAAATIPERVQRMILVDAMVGPEQPYGIYPQLVEHPQNDGRLPPPLRVYEGASFEDDPPHVRIPAPEGTPGRRPRRLPRWVDPVRFARLQAALRHHGKVWSITIGSCAVFLAIAMLARAILADAPARIAIESIRIVVFAGLTVGVAFRKRLPRVALALLLAAGGVVDLTPIVRAIVRGELPPVVMATGWVLIPVLFVVGGVMLVSIPAVRAWTDRSSDGTRVAGAGS